MMLEDGKKIIVEVSEKRNKRSLEQNNYYWLFCEQLASFLQEKEIMHKYSVLGVEIEKPFTKDTVHTQLNKPMFGIETTTKMTIGEFCEYMNKLLIFWSDKTRGAFQMSELPANYLERKGYIIK